jgi:hypothetical protein
VRFVKGRLVGQPKPPDLSLVAPVIVYDPARAPKAPTPVEYRLAFDARRV